MLIISCLACELAQFEDSQKLLGETVRGAEELMSSAAQVSTGSSCCAHTVMDGTNAHQNRPWLPAEDMVL